MKTALTSERRNGTRISFEVTGATLDALRTKAANQLGKVGYSGEMYLDVEALLVDNSTEEVVLWRAKVSTP
jgi:hypothetical protein